MSRKTSFPWSIVAAAAIAGATFAGIAGYVQTVRKEPLEPGNSTTKLQSEADKASDGSSIQAAEEENRRKGGEEQNSKNQQITQNRISSLKSSLESAGFQRIRVLGIDVKEGNALIDLSPSVRNGFGSSEEAQFLEAIKSGLDRYREIKTFQLRVDGQILDALSHVEISEPTPVR
jgi:hypothetical protein